MTKKQFLWLNLILSSNILLFIGIVLFFLFILFGGLFFFVLDSNKLYWFFLYFFIMFYFFYVFFKLFFLFMFSFARFKATYAFRFLKKILLNYRFRIKILFNVFIMDFVFNLILLNLVLLHLFPDINHNSTFVDYCSKGLKLFIFTGGGGVFLSYLIYIGYYEIIEILKINIF